MSAKKSEALVQSEYLENGWFDAERNPKAAAAELRRLHAANVELTKVIKDALQTAKFEMHAFRPWHADAKAAIAKHGV